MAEQQQKKKTRKKSQKEEDEEELLARNHKTKKRLEQSIASTHVRPTARTSVPQRLKDLSEIDEEDEGQVATVSKVMGIKVVLSNDTIAKATGCLHEGSTYQEGWENNYDSHVTSMLYRENNNKVGDQQPHM